jgi:threonine/homoserine/homoserine lactone efflux protein
MDNALAFAIVAFALVVSPGPDSLLILRNAMANRRDGLLTMCGVQFGVVAHTALAGAGLSAVLFHSPLLFKILAVAGALYLGGLGIAAWRTSAGVSLGGGMQNKSKRPGLGCLRAGMLCNLLNPKVLILFVALMPNFIDPAAAESRALRFAQLALILLAINIPFQTMLVFFAAPMRRALSAPRFALSVRMLTGGFLVFFSMMLLIEHVFEFAK